MLRQMAAVAELEAGLISERTKAAKVARDGQWDRKAKHHLVPGAGQRAASRERADQAARDLRPIIEEIKASGATSLRQIGQGLREKGIPSPRGGDWSASVVRNALMRG
jgi:DNA invertase Pin-like site-specific DNA recombinase